MNKGYRLQCALSIGVSLILSIAAVLVRLLEYYYVPYAIGSFLDWFVSPGEFVWFATIGGVFVGYPSTILGYALLIISNTLIWAVVIACVMYIGKWVLQHLGQIR